MVHACSSWLTGCSWSVGWRLVGQRWKPGNSWRVRGGDGNSPGKADALGNSGRTTLHTDTSTYGKRDWAHLHRCAQFRHLSVEKKKKWAGTRCVWLLEQFWVRAVMEGIHQTKDIASCRWAAPRGSPGTDIQMNRFQPQSGLNWSHVFFSSQAATSTIQKNHTAKKYWAHNTCGATGGSGWPVGDIQMNRLAARPRVAPFHAGPSCSS